MIDIFNRPIRKRKVRKDVTAYQYDNGVIVIDEYRYFGYSMTDAIKLFRNRKSGRSERKGNTSFNSYVYEQMYPNA